MKLASLVLFFVCPLTAWGAINEPCVHSKGAEKDISIHGRLAVYNGGYPNHRLWHIGTVHLFGIYGDARDARKGPGDSEEDRTSFPRNVDEAYNGENAFDVKLYGDFVIRPLERYKAGSMQPGCIVSAEHLIRKVN